MNSHLPLIFALLMLLLLHALALATAEESGLEYYCFRGASLLATSIPGVRFHALQLSDEVSSTADTPPVAAEEALRASTPTTPQESYVDVASRVGAMTGACFFMRGGYWTYEVCPGRRVRQYHSENALSGAATVHSEFSLGLYDGAGDEYVAARRTFSQRFPGGTEGRASKVQFICGDARGQEDGIVSVTEPADKKYAMSHHPTLLPWWVPPWRPQP